MKKNKVFSLIILGLFLFFLPILISLAKRTQRYLSQAIGKPAKIIVDVSVNQGQINPIWQNLAQGGEEKEAMLAPVIPQIKPLTPAYIRLDHIYDFYDVVDRQEQGLVFNWVKLDKVVDQILKTGAKPFLSLSFMPLIMAKSGQITDAPQNWLEWQLLVKETIEHYSGQDNKNLTDVCYEVWSEPDLFGNWKIGRGKDYRNLYLYAVLGAEQAKNTNPFKIGGPSSTALYRTWVDQFLNYVDNQNLRIDFYSWHRYSLNPKDFLADVDQIDAWLTRHGGYSLLPKYLTEWGPDSENSPLHDENFDAAHLVATTRQLLQRIDAAFIFEIKDGPPPEGKKYWGRWGLLTHDGTPKPKYQALLLLNHLQGKRLKLSGEGSWVTGLAAKNDQEISLILTNLDHRNQHQELVPVTFLNLENGFYFYQEFSLTSPEKSFRKEVKNSQFEKEVLMPPNEVILIKLSKAPPQP